MFSYENAIRVGDLFKPLSLIKSKYYYDKAYSIALDKNNSHKINTALLKLVDLYKEGKLFTEENTPIEVMLTNLTVEDDDNNYPDDFVLLLLDGDNYTIDGATVTPDQDFVGTLTIPTKVNDGYDYSDAWDLEIIVGDFVNVNDNNNIISLYPNPVKDELNIILNHSNYSKLQIIDITGKILLDENINKINKINVSTAKFQNGIYFCKLFGDNIIIEKFVIQK